LKRNTRIEIKCKVNNYNFKNIYSNFLSSYISFFKVHPDRNIKSIYYDNSNLSNYYDHVYGLSKRCKLRLRIYDSDFNKSDKYNFEIKKKNNFSSHKIIKKISSNNLISLPINFLPILLVEYEREYFSFLNGLRITFDKNINFMKVQNYNNRFIFFYRTKPNFSVIEFKFDTNKYNEYSNLINQIINNNSLVVEKYSKYVDAVERLKIIN
jgi:hypothetical protein